MKKQQVIFFLVLLAALIFLIIFKQIYRQNQFKQQFESGFSIQFAPVKIDKIEFIKNEKNKIELIKNSDWRIPALWNIKADPLKINYLFNELLNASMELRGSTQEVLSDFGFVDGETAILTLSSTGKSVLKLVVSPRIAVEGVFVRLDGQNSVYLIDKNLWSLLGVFGDPKSEEFKPDFWADLTLSDLDQSKVKFLSFSEIRNGKEVSVFQLEKISAKEGEENWIIKDQILPFPAGLEKIYHYFDQLKLVRGTKALDPNGNYGFNEPNTVIKIIFENNQEESILFKKVKEKDTESYYVQMAADKRTFAIPVQIFQDINVEPVLFMDQKPFLGRTSDWISVSVKSPTGEHKLTEKPMNEKAVWVFEGQENEAPQGLAAQYVNRVENFSIHHFKTGSDPEDGLDAIGNIWFEIESKAGEKTKIEVSDIPNSAGFYAGRKQNFGQIFYISKDIFDQIFNLPQRSIPQEITVTPSSSQ